MNLVRQVRESKQMSRYRLASISGLAYSLIFRIENGSDVHLSTLEKLAVALNVDVKDLVSLN